MTYLFYWTAKDQPLTLLKMKIQISVIIFFLCFNILKSEKRANEHLIPDPDTRLVKSMEMEMYQRLIKKEN